MSDSTSKKRRRVEDEDESEEDVQPLPSEVLSHAERRRQKKKQRRQQLEVTTKTDDDDDETDADRKPDPRRPKRQNSVWVGNLSFRTTPDGLRTFFDGVGAITRVHMPMQKRVERQENMGFAYVDFDSPDAKVIAIALSERLLDGRHLLIKDGNDFAGRPAKPKPETTTTVAQKILAVQQQPPGPTLFLGNLGFDTTEASIRELLEAHQKKNHDDGDNGDDAKVWLRKIRMGTFEDSGACKGFAFVDFTSVEHATAALVNPRNHRLNGRKLVVEYASPDAVRRGGGGGARQGKRKRDGKSGRGEIGAKKVSVRRHEKREDEEGGEEAKPSPSRPSDRAGHDRTRTRRAKPGAALAHAHRQSAAILPSQGEKIVF